MSAGTVDYAIAVCLLGGFLLTVVFVGRSKANKRRRAKFLQFLKNKKQSQLQESVEREIALHVEQEAERGVNRRDLQRQYAGCKKKKTYAGCSANLHLFFTA